MNDVLWTDTMEFVPITQCEAKGCEEPAEVLQVAKPGMWHDMCHDGPNQVSHLLCADHAVQRYDAARRRDREYKKRRQ